jgi:hypothetical protein
MIGALTLAALMRPDSCSSVTHHVHVQLYYTRQYHVHVQLYYTDHPMGLNPDILVHMLRAFHPRSGMPIRHVSRKLRNSPRFESIGARMIIGVLTLAALTRPNSCSRVSSVVRLRMMCLSHSIKARLCVANYII